MVIGTITECATAAAIMDTLLLIASTGDMRPGGAITATSKVTLPEIAEGNLVKD